MAQKVIYIAGHGHSGSTLLDLIVGSHSRVVSVGEITFTSLQRLFDLSKREKPCMCGARTSECPLWHEVLLRWEARGIGQATDILKPASPGVTADIISDILAVANRPIYAESTKNTTRLAQLLSEPDLDVFVLQILRDPRAVALSSDRKYGGFYKKTLSWPRLNAAIERLMEARPNRLLRVHYEKLVTAPAREMARVMEFCGETFEPEQIAFAGGEHHNIGGNKMRYNSTAIRPDASYIEKLDQLRWHLATVLALNAMRKYSYHLSRGAMRRQLTPHTP